MKLNIKHTIDDVLFTVENVSCLGSYSLATVLIHELREEAAE